MGSRTEGSEEWLVKDGWRSWMKKKRKRKRKRKRKSLWWWKERIGGGGDRSFWEKAKKSDILLDRRCLFAG